MTRNARITVPYRSLLTASFSRRGMIALAGAGLASAALALAGCGAAGAQQASGASAGGALKKVRFAVPGNDGTLIENAGIAVKEGFLAEELKKVGYEPVYNGFAQAGPAINEAFSSGSIDIAEYGDLPGYSAISKGVALKAFATANSSWHYGLFVTNKSGIEKPEDLKGKKVVAGLGTLSHIYLFNLLKSVNLTPKDLEIVNSASDGPAMVTAGQADAVVSPLISIYTIDQSIGHIIAPTNVDEYQSLAPAFLLFYRADFHKENPEVAPAITRALLRAYELVEQDKDKALADLKTKSLTADMIQKVYAGSDLSTLNPQITDAVKQKFASLVDFARENDIVKRDVSADEFFDEKVYADAGGK